MPDDPVVKSLDVHYHMQDIDTDCGPATAMMMLHYLSPRTEPLPQERLRQQIPTSSTSNGPPKTVADALNMNVPPELRLDFNVDSKCSVDEANDVIVRALYDRSAPVAVEYFHGNHWVVVRGVVTDIVPRPGHSYNVLGFFIHSPISPRDQGPFVHFDGDRCGHGPNFGPLHEFVSLADWEFQFRRFDGVYNSVVPNAVVEQWLAKPTHHGLARNISFDPLRQAMRGIQANRLDSEGPLSDLLKDAMATSFVGPLRDAYFVTLSRNGTNVGQARLAAGDGALLGVTVSEPGDFHRILSPAEMHAQLALSTLDFDGSRRILQDFHYTLSMPYWRPCREAVSPYYPFYDVFIEGDFGWHHCYATADAKLHTKLEFYDIPRR